jgi:hypothetical protein
VRGASPQNGPWPRVSVWHGGADATANLAGLFFAFFGVFEAFL